MNKLHDHYHCHLCRTDIEAKLDDYIAVTFTVSEQIRRSKFHGSDENFESYSSDLRPEGVHTLKEIEPFHNRRDNCHGRDQEAHFAV
jgi:hypothetical protein